MNLENISQKHRNDLEQQTRQLLVTIRRAKLENTALIEALEALELKLEQDRREMFDASNSEYQSY
jgi:hypothetical protein